VTLSQAKDVQEQGCLISGSVVNCYLNLLVAEAYSKEADVGARKGHDTFFAEAQDRILQRKETFKDYVTHVQDMADASALIDWETDKLIFLPIFVGHTNAGHWALLVVDRLYFKDGMINYFDSLPSFAPRTFDRLKKVLERSPLVKYGSNWYKADVPCQGKSTNDCAVWMCMNATAYLRAARERAGARTYDNCSIHDSRRAVVSIFKSMNVKNFGAAGRNHIFDSLSAGRVLWGSAACNNIVITWE
jgi:Ulp1 family protease